MLFKGITKSFSLVGEEQYNTIGAFWDELSEKYGLENLVGLGHAWHGTTIDYAIGLKNGTIDDCNLCIDLPDDGWKRADGETEHLKSLYDDIYKNGALTYEIETFFEGGSCTVLYYRSSQNE